MSKKKHNNNIQVNNSVPTPNHSKVQIAAQRFSGPIPPPEVLQKYDEVLPGLAERIMKQAEAQTAHRIEMEKAVINSDIRKSYLGITLGFILGLVGIAGGIYLTSLGMISSGLFISGGALVSLVGAFIYGTQTRRKEREARKN